MATKKRTKIKRKDKKKIRVRNWKKTTTASDSEPLKAKRKELVHTRDDVTLPEPVKVKVAPYGTRVTVSGSLVRTAEFDERHYYEGFLGAFYTKEKTLLRVWAPTAQEVSVEIWDSLNEFSRICEVLPLTYRDPGVWEAELPGDKHRTVYTYLLTFSDGTIHSSNDPYARAATVNGKKSVVLDPGSVRVQGFERMPAFTHPVDAVIYEIHIRDFSVDPSSGIRQRGKFLGITEKGTKNPAGSPTGLNYLKELGVTHVQVMPIFDFATVNETRPDSAYNWGYDPLNFNVPDGSYSSNPHEPERRIIELKEMIKSLHDAGFRVIMDVVYNHVYEVSDHPLHKTVPGYFFRYDKKGNLSNGTGVGNDTASERSMMRKYILDSIRYWLEEYQLDGFRFDLMGIHDIDTMNEVRRLADTVDPSIIILGEGWNLPTELPLSQRAWQRNAGKMPRIAHFNDSLRDAVKGSTFYFAGKGFISGHHYDQKIIADSLFGHCDPASGSPYLGPDQVIQYVEAHDNHTLYDKLLRTNPKDPEKIRIRRHTLATSLVLLAQGVPFIHGGQEFLRTKLGVENSYRSDDDVNRFDWMRREAYHEALEYVKGLIRLRREHRLFRLRDASAIGASLQLLQCRSGLLSWRLKDEEEELLVLVNGNDKESRVAAKTGLWQCLVKDMVVSHKNEKLRLKTESVPVAPLSVMVLRRLKQ